MSSEEKTRKESPRQAMRRIAKSAGLLPKKKSKTKKNKDDVYSR